ncbi:MULTISPECIES: tryptophan-rich sensory protein [unclassified Curtobacterium]|uniref:tryptophan-rich sensory protein n=1 Tax=unclassified Curtobacterium TaxID=257496 RepID=UPI000DA7AC16|nr:MULTISPECIES: tryptophan-rich sensory protein [unclassified Curtobacterium]PZE65564.1 tryptophan-rich sensory protein [Curtobacterium sp. MCPF17_018]PZF27464.1 tryptophan-rich sensory protein [Curtobacterium sp. MCPF17_051]
MKRIWKRIAVAVSAVVAVIGAYVGSGAAGGTPIQDAAGGALSASSTAIAPDGPAFSIWSVVYAGLIGYAVLQLFRTANDERHERLVVPAVLSLLLNAAWILSVQFGFLWASEPIIVALLVVLIWTFTILRRTPSRGVVEAILTDGTFGLYLGWVCVATAANTAAVLTAAGFRGFGLGQDPWGVVVAAVAGLVGVLIALWGRGRLAPMASLAWGLAWVSVARFEGPLVSVPTAVAAMVAAAAVVVVTVVVRARVGWVGGRAGRAAAPVAA